MADRPGLTRVLGSTFQDPRSEGVLVSGPLGSVRAATMSFSPERTECGEQIVSSIHPLHLGAQTARRILCSVRMGRGHRARFLRSSSSSLTLRAIRTLMEIAAGKSR